MRKKNTPTGSDDQDEFDSHSLFDDMESSSDDKFLFDGYGDENQNGGEDDDGATGSGTIDASDDDKERFDSSNESKPSQSGEVVSIGDRVSESLEEDPIVHDDAVMTGESEEYYPTLEEGYITDSEQPAPPDYGPPDDRYPDLDESSEDLDMIEASLVEGVTGEKKELASRGSNRGSRSSASSIQIYMWDLTDEAFERLVTTYAYEDIIDFFEVGPADVYIRMQALIKRRITPD